MVHVAVLGQHQHRHRFVDGGATVRSARGATGSPSIPARARGGDTAARSLQRSAIPHPPPQLVVAPVGIRFGKASDIVRGKRLYWGRAAVDVQEPSPNAGDMPEISRFFGIVIKMFFSDHSPPHFHAESGYEALIMIETLEVLRGNLPRRALALVLEWAAAHRQELRADWDRARSGQTLAPIPPLE